MINFGDVTKGNIKKNHPVACKSSTQLKVLDVEKQIHYLC